MADSTSKRPQDDQGGPPQKKPRLYDRLESSSFTEKTAEEVAQYFENKGYHTLKEATAGMKGDDVIANFRDFQQNHPGEVNQWADSVDSDPLFQPNLVAEKKVFSTNTTILRDSGYFYVSRRSTATLGRVIKKERREGQGNYILLHGPRASGKSTLMRQIISKLDPDIYEWGLLQLSEREKDWNGVMIDLANNQAATTEGCRQAAQDYLDMDMEKRPGNALKHLFRHNYGGKKLILFWDEFDNAYAPESKFLVGPHLREVQNMVIFGGLPSFQAIAFFGSYNANLVTSMGGSQFTFNTIHSHETVDFTLDETKELFEQYQKEYKESKVEVSPEVIEDIHKLTGGHAGLTNLCGDVILKSQMLDKAPFTMERWRSAFSKVVDRVFVSQTYKNMLQALNRTENPEKTKELLRALCYSSGHDAATNESEALQNLGFAKKEPDGLLYIKSQLIKILSLTHILGEAPPFTEVPRLPGTQEIDIPALVVACVRSFKPLIIWSSSVSAKKRAYNLPTTAPLEVIYQCQFHAALVLAYPPDSPLGSFEYEVTLPSSRKRLDFIIIDKERDHRIGLEFVASSSPGEIAEHASRKYPSGLQLDKYIVIHFLPSSSQAGPYFSEGENKAGGECQVPIYHIIHDEKFKEVVLCHKEKPEDDAQPTKTNILPPPGN